MLLDPASIQQAFLDLPVDVLCVLWVSQGPPLLQGACFRLRFGLMLQESLLSGVVVNIRRDQVQCEDRRTAAVATVESGSLMMTDVYSETGW